MPSPSTITPAVHSPAGCCQRPFGDVEMPVLSIEDLLVCKLLFDRPKVVRPRESRAPETAISALSDFSTAC